ncbi:MAG: serine/threonine-protein kinase, partial [Myxococcaceae bacterium]
MPSTTGIRRRLSPAMLAGAPYRIGDRMADRYLVKDAIGLGPVGYVFRATDEQQGIDVAVKMIHPRFVQTAEEREAFTRAVEPARKFLQPSLARVHDLGVDQGWPYLTYSFLDGLTLRRMIDSRLAKGQTFTLEEVEPFLGQLAAALEASHPIGAHADLKPENVVILPDMLRVVDWGVARGLPRLPFVQAQRQKSTHRYLAPEVVAGAEPDPRADLYALGVLVGEMLTGLTPDEDIPELRLTASELPEAVEGFYRRALNERPESRFRSVRELYEEFLSLLAPAESQAVTPAATGTAATGAAATEAAATPADAPGDTAPAGPASVPPAPVADTAARGSEAPLDWAME